MKTYLLFLLFLTSLSAFGDTTNLTFRITVETISSGVTNSTVTTLKLDGSTAKDTLLSAGALDAWARYRASGGTAALDLWLKQDIRDRLMEYARAKLLADNATLVTQLTTLLTSQSDNLSLSDINNLKTIGAKAP